MKDPLGLLLQAARVDPTLMQAARQVEAEMRQMREVLWWVVTDHIEVDFAEHIRYAAAKVRASDRVADFLSAEP